MSLHKRYIGSSALAKRYDKSVRTIMRWVKSPPPGFPAPIKLNDRNLWDVEKLEAYERSFSEPKQAAA